MEDSLTGSGRKILPISSSLPARACILADRGLGEAPGERAKRTLDTLTFGGGRRVEINRRKEPGASSRGCFPRLLHAREGGRQIEILVERALYDRHQHRVVETGPPPVELRCGRRGMSACDRI